MDAAARFAASPQRHVATLAAKRALPFHNLPMDEVGLSSSLHHPSTTTSSRPGGMRREGEGGPTQQGWGEAQAWPR